MGAISYEHVLRKVYSCGPINIYGANALVYNNMELAYADLQTRIIYNQQDKEFKQKFAVVRNNVYEALRELIKLHRRLVEDDKKLLQGFLTQLKPNFFDKDHLDNILLKVGEMLSKYNGD